MRNALCSGLVLGLRDGRCRRPPNLAESVLVLDIQLVRPIDSIDPAIAVRVK